jgi:hypothetical protein
MKINRKKSLALLKETIQFNEYYRSEGYSYFDQNDLPVCLLGHVFSKLGLGLNDFKFKSDKEYTDYDYGVNTATLDDLKIGGIKLTRKAEKTLLKAQEIQDEGKTWGSAFEEAELLEF